MKNRKIIDYSTRDYEGFRNDLIKLLKQKMPEYTDFSQSDAGIVLIELLSHGLDVISYYNDVVANEIYLDTARDRENVIKLTNQIGYFIKNAVASRFTQVFEVIPSEEEQIIPEGTLVHTKSDVEEIVEFETLKDLVIPPNKTGLEKDVGGAYIYSVDIKQGRTINQEVLGTSKGNIDQVFKLGYKNALDEDIQVIVNEGEVWKVWNRVESFLDSESDSEDYLIKVNESDETSIVFGNGISGRIPPSLVNGIIATYRVGGGVRGNIAPNKITEIRLKPAFIKSTFNPYEPYIQGKEKESNESAKLRSTAQLRTLWRAVTIYDFYDIAYELEFVKFVRARENYVEALVDIYVLPDTGNVLTELQIEKLNELYSVRKLIGVNFRINQPLFKTIDFEMQVKVLPKFINSEVMERVDNFMTEEFKLGNYDFESAVNLSELTRDIILLEGVRSVAFITPENLVELDYGEIPILGSVVIETIGGIDE